MTDNELFNSTPTRRGFLRQGATAALVAGVVTACKDDKQPPADQHVMQAGGAVGPSDSASARMANEMDAMHEKGVKAFPAKTGSKGNQLCYGRVDQGVKIFELTAKKIQ